MSLNPNVLMSDLLCEWQQEHKATRLTEGATGFRNLCRLVRVMGYQDPLRNGQFSHDGAYGDLMTFLEDNPGAMEAIIDWITTGGDRVEEWKDNIADTLSDETIARLNGDADDEES